MAVYIEAYDVHVSDEVAAAVRAGGGRNLVVADTGLGSHRAAQVVRILRLGPYDSQTEALVPPLAEEEVDEAVGGGEYNALKWITDHDYRYNDDADSYEVFLASAKGKMEIPGKAIRDLREWYCGQKMTQNQCAQRLGMPRSWLVELLHTFGITKDDLPLTDEEVKNGTVENLAVRALQSKKRVVALKIETRERRDEQRVALRWRTWAHERQRAETEFLALLDAREHAAPSVIERFAPDPTKPIRGLVCNHQDLHLGVRAVGSDVLLAQQTESRMRGFTTVLEKATRANQIECVVLNMLPDAGHTDGGGKTTSGTQVEANASDGEIGVAVMDLAIDMVNRARQVAPVTFVLDRGNHNAHAATLAGHAVARYFENTPEVTLAEKRGPLCLAVYGDHLLVFLHGDVPRKGLEKIGNLLIAKARDLLGVTKYVTIHTGHLHHEAVFDDGGVLRRQTPAGPETDAYHSDNLYVGARKLMQGIVMNPHGYDDDTVTASLEHAYE